MLRFVRAVLRPTLLLLIGTGALLCIYTAKSIVPQVQDFRLALDSQISSTRAMLTGSARLVLKGGASEEASRLVEEISGTPLIKGVIVSNDNNRVVAGAWMGEPLSEADAVDKILHENLQRWPIAGESGRSGVIFVALDEAWPKTLESELMKSALLVVSGVLLFALLISINVRNSLARRVTSLRHAASCIARGEYDIRVPVRGRGPVAELTRHFNKMAKDLRAFTDRLRASEERFELAMSGSNEAIWDWNFQDNHFYLSPRYAELLGFEEREIPGMFTAWQRQVHPDDWPSLSEALNQHIRHGKTFRHEFRVQTKEGGWRWMLGRGTLVRAPGGTPTRMVGSLAEYSEQKAMQLLLEREKERAQVTLKSIADAVLTTDNARRVTYLNPAAERLTGWSSHEALRKPVESVLRIINESGRNSVADLLQTRLMEQADADDIGQMELLSRSGEKHVIEHSIAPLRDRHEKVIGGVIVIHDVTDHYKLMQQLSHQAIHDPLTQLINRTGFELRLNECIKSATEHSGVVHAVCYMDMDQFKTVNDTCGHAAGDELLRQIAAHLQKNVRKGDTLARLGGDEFGLLLECCPLAKAEEISEKIRRAVESFRFSWEGKTFSIGLSIGLAPFDGRPGFSVASILSSVDQACYIAKSKGRNRIHIYQPGDIESSRWQSEVQWVPHIHRAMDEGNFVLLAQPIVAVNKPTDPHRHYEILLRMRAANGELIAPGSFMPAAERYNLMGALDRWVVAHAIDTLAMAWGHDSDLAMTTFGINISGAVLSDNSLLSHVKQTLAAYKLPPSLLCFEITETVAIANFTHAHRFVNELKEIGCRFALDDFGSGFASFSYLKTLPVDYLKIDGSFVRHLLENKVDHTMVDIINQLGHVMNLQTIAEFVENEDILNALRILGVDYAQGYHFGMPTPLTDILYGEGTADPLKLSFR